MGDNLFCDTAVPRFGDEYLRKVGVIPSKGVSMRMHHIGYAVPSLAKAEEVFSSLGFHVVSTCQDVGRGIAIMLIANSENICIELIEPLAEKSPVKNILKKCGPAPYHLCFSSRQSVQDITTSLCAKGFSILKGAEFAPALGGDVVFFYSPFVGIIEMFFERSDPMTKTEFLACIEDLVEAPHGSLRMENALADIDNFDSMTVLGLISFAESQGLTFSMEDFGDVKCLADIYAILTEK